MPRNRAGRAPTKTDMSVAERLDKMPWSFDPKAVTMK
jgi:hypothetical protein